MKTLYLTARRPDWLATMTDPVPLAVSHLDLAACHRLPEASAHWILEPGAAQLAAEGTWSTTPRQYIAAVRRYDHHIGRLDFVTPQHWDCTPHTLSRTRLGVASHQRNTVNNFLALRQALGLQVMPVLQGWRIPEDYLACADLYATRGVDLTAEPRVGLEVGDRQQNAADVAALVGTLANLGVSVHGLGVGSLGQGHLDTVLTSADSAAWLTDGPTDAHTFGCYRPRDRCPRCAASWHRHHVGVRRLVAVA